MNHIYKVIWNTVTQTWVAVSELSRAKGKTKSSKTLSTVVLAAVSAGAVVGDAEAATNFVQNQTGIAITRSGGDAPATASDRWAIAVGDSAKANSEYSIAVGGHTNATGESAIAIGKQTKVEGQGATAVGRVTLASAQYSSAYGAQAKATGNQSTALGYVANAAASNSLAAGALAQAQGESSVALGRDAQAWGSGASAVGEGSRANNSNAFAGGNGAQATGSWATAVGPSTLASGEASAAYGDSSEATGKKSIATGSHASASAENAIAIGNSTKAQANNTIAIGNDTKATDKSENSLVIGQGAVVTAKDATVVGPVAQANGENATAVGRGAAANGTESTALGRGSVATGNQSIALGKGANAKVDSGVALGDNSVADRTARSQNGIVINTSNPSKSTGFNTENSVYAPVRLVDDPEALNLIKNTIKGNKGAVSVGDSGNTRQIINVAAGSADSDAVNVAQLKAVVGTIKHYDVTSPNGDITVTHPNPQDPNKTVWNLNLNPDRVKEITKWKLRDVEENGNPKAGQTDALVKGDETVTFQDTDTINVERVGTDGKTLKFHTKKNIKYFSVNSSGGTNEDNKGATGDNAIAIGKDAASSANNAVVIGKSATALKNNERYDLNVGTATSNADSAVVIGNSATSKQARTVAIGNEAQTLHTSAIAIGDKAYTNGARGIAIGRNAQSKGNNSIALGSGDQNDGKKTTADKDYAVAIGSDAVANIANGIALGSESKTTAPSGQTGFDASTHDERANHYSGLNGKTLTSNLAGLSIGNSDKTRQINHLAAGKEDDDAVNVAQLKSVNLAFKGNSGSGDVRLHDQRLSVVGAKDSFITTKASDNKLEIGTKTGTIAVTEATGAVTPITTATGLVTDKTVADAIAKSGFQLKQNGTLKNVVNPGESLNFKPGQGTTVSVGENGDVQVNADVAGIQAGDNVRVDKGNNGVYTINAIDTNTQASVSKESGSPITVRKTATNPNSPDYAIGLDIDNKTLEIKNGKLAAKTQAQAVESVEKKAGDDNIAEVDVKTGEQGKANAVYTVAVTKSAVKEAAAWKLKAESGEAQTVSGGDTVTFKNSNTINATVSANKEVTLTANTGSIEEVSPSENADNTPTKKGQVKAGSGDENKVATVSNVANAINKAKWFAKADNNGGEIADNEKTNDAENADGQAMSAGDKLILKAGKNLRVKRDGANFTFATNNDVTFNKVTSNEVAISNDGKFTVGSGATINMGDNIIHGVKAGEANTDAVNLAQLKANTTTVEAGKNVTVTSDINSNGRKYTVDAEKSVVTATGPVTVTPTPNNTEHTTTYNVGLNIDNDSLVVEKGKLKAKTQAQAVESVEKKEGDDNIAEVDVKSGSTKGAANAVYTVAVTKSAVREAAAWKLKAENGDAQTVSGGDTVTFKNSNTINATVSANKEVTLTANTGSIEEVSPSENADNTPTKKGQVKAGSGDENKVATVSNVANAINKAKWFAKADNSDEDLAETKNDNGEAVNAGSELTFKAGKNLHVNRTNGVFTFALNNDINLTNAGSLTIGETKVDNGGITITPTNLGEGKTAVKLTGEGLNNGGNKIVNVAAGEGDHDAVNVKQLKSTERHITPNTYTYNDTDKSVTLTYTDGNGNLVKDTKAKIDLSGLASKIKDYSFKTNATGSNLVGTGTETTVASGKSVNFAASDNLTLKQDVNNGNVTYTYGLKNQVVVGEKGTPGADGKPGKDGVDGSIGVNGKDGSAVAINGKDGSIGLNGKDGKNGLTIKGDKGAFGVDGTNGKDGKDGMTRIVYTDNNNVKHEVATLDDGQKYAGDNYVAAKDNQAESNVIAKKANERLDIVGGAKGNLTEGNIGVNAKDGKLHVQLAEKVNLGDKGSVTIGDTVVNNNGITINSSADPNGVTNKTVSLTNQGLNNGGNKITNVAEGENDTDAVNVKQLKAFKTEVGGYGWNLSVNNGKDTSKITKDTTVDLNNDDGNIKIAKNGSNVTLSLGPDVGLGKAGKDGKDGSLAVRGKDGASVEISGKDGSIGLTGPKGKDGTPGASATITVEKGTTTVNDGRDGDNKVNRIVYTDKDKNGNDIKREVATLDDGLKFKGDSKEVINRTLGSQMNITGGADENKLTDKNIGVVYDKATNGLKVKLSKDVNLGDNGTITIGDTVVNKDGLTINGGPSVTKGGVNAGNQSVTNVKDGVADNDAVNVKQLKAAKTEVEAGDHIDVTSREGANGQTIYKVSVKGINDTSAAVKGGSDHVKVTKAANTHKDGSTTVTDYTVDLSNKTKEDIKKGVDAHTEVTTKGLTFNADKGTTGVKKLGSKVSVNGDGKNITTTADENGVKVSMKDDIKVNSVTAKEVKVGNVNINENGINAGGKRITNVAPGKDGTDAVNVNQLKYVAGNISNQINNVDKGLRAGIAGALASGGLYHATTSGKSMVSVGAGTYRGQNALAVGYSRLSDNGKVGVKFTVNSNSQGHAGASASVGYQW